MTNQSPNQGNLSSAPQRVHFFQRFTVAQRWEHTILLITVTVLLLTGLPQKFRTQEWSQYVLSTPERVETIQQIHHIAALFLTLLVIYHLGHAIFLMARRKLPGEMLPVWQDVLDAGHMLRYLLFISKDKPKFGKYNFEQKFTYWFLFFGIGLLVISGFIIWFPIQFTKLLPGEIIPAAKMAHSTEALVAGIFIVIWHFYHVHIERLNLSIFTGRLNEEEMKEFHTHEYERMKLRSPESNPEQQL
jgi:formate dehydrogenase gamma subunit